MAAVTVKEPTYVVPDRNVPRGLRLLAGKRKEWGKKGKGSKAEGEAREKKKDNWSPVFLSHP